MSAEEAGHNTMILRKYWLLVAVLLALCVTITVWRFHRTPQVVHYSCSPVVPKIGDAAVVDLYIRKPGAKPGHAALTDYRTVVLRIRCVAAHGLRCKFNVYTITEGKPDKLEYSVAVDYTTNDLDRRTEVRDAGGHLVPPRVLLVGGNPVAFRYFLAFAEGYLEPGERKLQGSGVRLRRLGGNGVRTWCVQLARGTSDSNPYDLQSQWWRSGDWIWDGLDACGWYAIRRSITGARSQPASR